MLKIEFKSSVPSLTPERLLGDHLLTITCPGCSHEFSVKFREVMVDGAVVTCPGCKEAIRLDHDETTKTTLRELRQQLKDLEHALKNLGR